MPGRPEMQNLPQRDSGPGVATSGKSRLIPSKHTEKDKVNLEARWTPPFPEPPCMPYPMGYPWSQDMGYELPTRFPHSWPLGYYPPPPLLAFG